MLFFSNFFWEYQKCLYICTRIKQGTLAQLVEQRTENPCVPGSIPGGTTKKPEHMFGFFYACSLKEAN